MIIVFSVLIFFFIIFWITFCGVSTWQNLTTRQLSVTAKKLTRFTHPSHSFCTWLHCKLFLLTTKTLFVSPSHRALAIFVRSWNTTIHALYTQKSFAELFCLKLATTFYVFILLKIPAGSFLSETSTKVCPWRTSGVVSGTTVRALVLGRFSQTKLKTELKDNAKKWIKIFHIIKPGDALAIWAADVCSRAARQLICTRLRLRMADPCTKFEVSSVSRCGDIYMGCKILKRVTWPWLRPFQGRFFTSRVGLAMVN